MAHSPYRFSVVLGLLVATATTVSAGAQLLGALSPKISPDAAAAASSTTVPVIIQYQHDPGTPESNHVHGVGGLVKSPLHSIHAFTENVSQDQLTQLAADPSVTYISLDRPLAARQAGTITGAEYTTEPINAPAVWQQGYVGTQIGVAVIDSGITPVPDLSINATSLLPLVAPSVG